MLVHTVDENIAIQLFFTMVTLLELELSLWPAKADWQHAGQAKENCNPFFSFPDFDPTSFPRRVIHSAN